jgi:predicted transcriptional regulator
LTASLRDSRFANIEYAVLKPQDIVVALRLVGREGSDRTFLALAMALDMSASETHAAVQRAATSGLVEPKSRIVNKSALLELLVHGVRYVYPAERLGVTRGVPTSYAAAPLSAQFSIGELPPVWPHPEGAVRGEGLQPLYKSVAGAALRDPELHEWLALVDAVRAGRARERQAAIRELSSRLST